MDNDLPSQPSDNPHPSGANDPLEKIIREYVECFVAENKAANAVNAGLSVIGVGLRPIVDHFTFWTLSIENRAKEFMAHGYEFDESVGLLECSTGVARVLRKSGYPAILIEQPLDNTDEKSSVIHQWVAAFGEKQAHHLAIRVDNLEQAMYYMEKQGIPFTHHSVGDRDGDLREVLAKPEMKNGLRYSVLELTERHRGFEGFVASQLGELIDSEMECD